MKNIIYLFIILNVLACKNPVKNTRPQTTPQISFKKQGELQIIDNHGHVKANFDIEIAKDDYTRETGLMYRRTMKDNQAMLFIFDDVKPRYFYMKNTFIPLDIIYIGPDKKIVHIVRNAKVLDETSLPSIKPAKYTLEIKAGLADRYHLKEGDLVRWK